MNKKKYKEYTTEVTWSWQDRNLRRWKRTVYQGSSSPEVRRITAGKDAEVPGDPDPGHGSNTDESGPAATE